MKIVSNKKFQVLKDLQLFHRAMKLKHDNIQKGSITGLFSEEDSKILGSIEGALEWTKRREDKKNDK